MRGDCLQQSLPKRELPDAADMRMRHARGDFRTAVAFPARPPHPLGRDIVGAITRMQERDRLVAALPGIDCGACGSPTCATFAEDVVLGEAEQSQCVFVHEQQLVDRLAQLVGPAAGRMQPPAGSPEVQR